MVLVTSFYMVTFLLVNQISEKLPAVTTLNDFNVDGDATFDGTPQLQAYSLTGAVTAAHQLSQVQPLSDTLAVTGATTLSDTLAVSGAATFSDDATISGTLALGNLTDVESSINTNSTNISSNDTDIATNATIAIMRRYSN